MVVFPVLNVGDTVDFTTALASYPANAGWVLKFRLVPRTVGPAPIAITCGASGSDHRAQVTAAVSVNWIAGFYGWTAYVENGAISITVDSGELELLPNLRTAVAGFDSRSQAEIALAAAQAALAAWSPTTKRYQIAGREMEFNSAAEIITVISYWRGEVQRERRAEDLAAGLKDRRKIFVRLGRG